MAAGAKRFRVAVIGSWHQASVVSACVADLGNDVVGITETEASAAALNAGRAPVYEPGLDEMIQRNVAAARLHYTTSYSDGLNGADFALLCIDTPVGEGDESDLTSIYVAADNIGRCAAGPLVLCVSAQVPIGTCDEISKSLRDHRPECRIDVVYVPEFLRLGTAIQTFKEADRFVIGSDDPEVAARTAAFYEPLGRPVYLAGRRSAEMAKHASNAFLATSISFINQIADLCEKTDADATEVAAVMKLDSRIGPKAFLSAGMGYAGGTLGREIRALQHLGKQCNVSTELLDAVAVVNEQRIPRIMERLLELNASLDGARICVFGLTYKPGTSTLRRSAALQLIDLLLAEGAHVTAFDPLARMDAGPTGFTIHTDPLKAASGASTLVLIAPRPEMSQFDFGACARVMRHARLLDTGNYLSPCEATQAGFTYVGIGRGKA